MKVKVFVKATKESEAGVPPSAELLTEMMKFNEELVKSGILLDGQGLHPSSKGARVEFRGNERKIVDGPFAETKELVAGYWLWEVRSMAEAVEWARRIPNPTGQEGVVELRPLFEMSDFPHATDETKALAAKLQMQ